MVGGFNKMTALVDGIVATIKCSEDSKVIWHNWPDEKPEKEDRYLIYCERKDRDIKATFVDDYFPSDKEWRNLGSWNILKWAAYNKPDFK